MRKHRATRASPPAPLLGSSLTPDPSRGGEGSGYYMLDGRKLNKKPTQKGLYIYNGKKKTIK